MKLNQPYYIEPRTGSAHLDLCGEWDYAFCDSKTDCPSNLNWNLKTQIPNSVYWSVYESGLLPHPYESCNSKKYHWVDEKVWYYRKKFTLSPEQKQDVAYLCADGAAYYSRVWVNGIFIGDHEGMFGGPFAEIGRQLYYDRENEIIFEIKACNFGIKDKFDPWNAKGENRAIVPWDIARNTQTSTGDFIVLGLWKGIRIEFLKHTHLSRPYLVTKYADSERAELALQLELASDALCELAPYYGYTDDCYSYTRAYDFGLTGAQKSEEVQIQIELWDKTSGTCVFEKTEAVPLMDYENSLIDARYYECQFYETEFTVLNPRLWYPHGMGEPFLYSVTITLKNSNGILDTQTFDYGIRTIETRRSKGGRYRTRWEDFLFAVNGQEIFLKGVNWMPTDFLYKTSIEDYKWTLGLAKHAGVQLIRIWSGGGMPETDEFYQVCDELGLMVWQDHMIANTVSTQGWPQDVLEAQEAMNLYRIRNHPSLAIHCGGNEFNPYSFGNAAAMFVIDRTIRTLDPARPFHYTTSDKGSAHVYHDMEPIWYRHLYKQLPFLAESGIHCFPNYKSLRQLLSVKECQSALPDLSSPAFAEEFPELLNHFTEYIPERVPRMLARASQIADISSFRLQDICESTQIASCEFYQIMIEAMRENYPVTTGVIPWVFKRTWTTVGIQLVDGVGDPTAPYYYVKGAYQLLHIFVRLEYLTFAAGETAVLPVCIINDSKADIGCAEAELQIFTPDLHLAYSKTQHIQLSKEQYLTAAMTVNFEIPPEYEEKFFFVRTALKSENRILSQTVYWPKCLGMMRDETVKSLYRSKPQPNFKFTNGPWLKEQVTHAPCAELVCGDIAVLTEQEHIFIDFELKNLSETPAFPVRIDIAEPQTLCAASDNYYFQSGGEVKRLHIEVWNKNPALKSLTLEISAWNANTIHKQIKLEEA